MKNELFSDVFEVTQIDANGKKFDRVSRIAAISEQTGMTMELDVNVEIYPVSQGDHLVMMLVSSLSLSGDDGPAAQRDEWRSVGTATKTLADDYDYVMHGKVYKYNEQDQKVSAYVSFGGLLMCLAGDYTNLQEIHVGQTLYLMMHK